MSSAISQPASNTTAPKTGRVDGQRDFDFEIGTWKTRVSRLQQPLSGSTTWVDYEGTTVVKKILGGRANVAELDVSGPAGRIEGLSLRLYEPATRQWTLNFSNVRTGTLSPPVYGRFKAGRGEFFGMDTVDGRAVFVRFVIGCASATTCRFEQAFSADAGKSWEVNWVAVDDKVGIDGR